MVVATDAKQPEAVLPPFNPPESRSDTPVTEDAPKSSPSVRFQSTIDEIAPISLVSETEDSTRTDDYQTDQTDQTDVLASDGYKPDAHVTPDQLSALTNSFRTAQLQGLRIANYAYEPVSLPASRTASNEDGSSHHATRQHTPSSTTGSHSPMLAAKGHDVHSPPLTPLASSHVDGDSKSPKTAAVPPVRSMSPQTSTREASPSRLIPTLQRPVSSDDGVNHPASSSETHDNPLSGNHRHGLFSIGPTTSGSGSGTGGGSLSVSRESSASERSAMPYYSRPFTPSGDLNDPYAANKRHPQNKIEPRFVFSRLGRRKDPSPTSSTMSLSKNKDDKRHSTFFAHHHHKADDTLEPEESSAASLHSRQASMSDLKRFFRLGPSYHTKIKRAVSPAVSIRSQRSTRTTDTSSGPKSGAQIPFGDEYSLTSKYGKLGKVLGAGAGGSVRLMKRSEDSTVFAVKEFRARHVYESEKEYVKKLTAEYCIGSSLHHGNIIETLDIINEKGKWYEVMEYAPYDLFAIVMTGRMTRPEVACCFLQILSGVTYLHSMGLAHRDLKLDNVVVSEYGIMKLIDFGSAHVFQYPFENGVVMASGIVGSDPYLAPEVYDERKYDPTAVDIWSLAIIFCCMTLRRFPWKVPRDTDNSYKLFAADPTPGHDPSRLGVNQSLPVNHGPVEAKKVVDAKHEEPVKEEHNGHEHKDGHHDHHWGGFDKHKHDKKEATVEKPVVEKPVVEKPAATTTTTAATTDKPVEKKEVIRGPWRILRLLPRESRHVVGGMLKIDPKERIKMSEILKDPWVTNTVICRQVQPGKVIRANTHTHVLEAPSAAAGAAK